MIFAIVSSYNLSYQNCSLIQGSFPPDLSISASNADNVCSSSMVMPLVRFLRTQAPFKSPMSTIILSPSLDYHNQKDSKG